MFPRGIHLISVESVSAFCKPFVSVVARMPLSWPCRCFSTVHISPYKYKTFKINFFLMIQIYISKEWKSSYQITFVSKLELSSFFKKEVTATSQFILIKKDLTLLTPCWLLYFILWSLKALYYVSSYFLYLTHFYILKLTHLLLTELT